MPKTETMILQEKVRGQFGDQVKNNQARLCQSCVSWSDHCKHGLLPVTSRGEDCPYFRAKIREVTNG